MILCHVEKVVTLTNPSEEIQRTKILLEPTKNAEVFKKFFELMPQGEESGLDADMVDGLHANEIIAKAKTIGGGGGSSHTHPYCKIKTGTYTGDGTTSQQITGVGFRPKFVKIWVHPESLQEIEIWMFEKTDTMRAEKGGDGGRSMVAVTSTDDSI